jgi:hypothetical protein
MILLIIQDKSKNKMVFVPIDLSDVKPGSFDSRDAFDKLLLSVIPEELLVDDVNIAVSFSRKLDYQTIKQFCNVDGFYVFPLTKSDKSRLLAIKNLGKRLDEIEKSKYEYIIKENKELKLLRDTLMSSNMSLLMSISKKDEYISKLESDLELVKKKN